MWIMPELHMAKWQSPVARHALEREEAAQGRRAAGALRIGEHEAQRAAAGVSVDRRQQHPGFVERVGLDSRRRELIPGSDVIA